jgi:hypothetical protein
MLTFAGIDPKIYPPKPKYEKKLPTIYTRTELAVAFTVYRWGLKSVRKYGVCYCIFQLTGSRFYV